MFPTKQGKWRNRREIGWKSGGEEPSGEGRRAWSTDTGLAALESDWHTEGLSLSLFCVVDEIISSCPPLNLRRNLHRSPVPSELKVLFGGDAVKCWVTSEGSEAKQRSLKGSECVSLASIHRCVMSFIPIYLIPERQMVEGVVRIVMK